MALQYNDSTAGPAAGEEINERGDRNVLSLPKS